MKSKFFSVLLLLFCFKVDECKQENEQNAFLIRLSSFNQRKKPLFCENVKKMFELILGLWNRKKNIIICFLLLSQSFDQSFYKTSNIFLFVFLFSLIAFSLQEINGICQHIVVCCNDKAQRIEKHYCVTLLVRKRVVHRFAFFGKIMTFGNVKRVILPENRKQILE